MREKKIDEKNTLVKGDYYQERGFEIDIAQLIWGGKKSLGSRGSGKKSKLGPGIDGR